MASLETSRVCNDQTDATDPDPTMLPSSGETVACDTFQVSFEPHECPLGLVLDWSNVLPVVIGVDPASAAELRPEIMPGQVLVAINDYLIPQGASQENVNAMFRQYESEGFVLSFAVPPNRQHPNVVHTQAPMYAYQVGECYRALTPLMLRAAESLESEVLAEFDLGTVLEVLERGVGSSGRRLKVQALRYVGWISCMAATGKILLDTMPAELSEVSLEADRFGVVHEASNAELMPSDLGLAVQNNTMPSEKSSALVEYYTSAAFYSSVGMSQTNTSPYEQMDPKLRRRMMLEESKFRKPPGQQRPSSGFWGGRFSLRGSGLKRRGSIDKVLNNAELFYTSARDSFVDIFLPASIKRRTTVTTDETDGFSDDDFDEDKAGLRSKENMGTVIIAGKEMDYRTVACQRLDLDENGGKLDPKEVETRRRRCERWTGLLQLRIIVMTQRVKLENEGPPNQAAHALCHDLRFETFIGFMILMNGISIALETFYKEDEPRPPYLNIAEHIFTAVFLIEFFLRVMANTWLYFFSLMNLFDTYLVWSGVLVMWVLPVMNVDATFLRRFGALRILRLARLCRAVRLIPFFKELYMLVQGVMECTSLLSWTLIIGGLVLYTFSVAIIELISKDPKFEGDETVEVYFKNLTGCMLTLFQLMTFDGWAPIVRSIVEKDPKSGVLFMVYLGFAGIVLFNLMTAIVVRNAFDAAAADGEANAQYKAAESSKLRGELLEMFQDLDEDGSGELSEDEFKDCLDSYEFVQKMKLLDIELEDLPDIFEILDDGDGQVSQEEFCHGLENLAGPAMSGEMLLATRQMKEQSDGFKSMTDVYIQSTLDAFQTMNTSVDSQEDDLILITQLCAAIVDQVDKIGIGKVVRNTTGMLPFADDPDKEDLLRTPQLRRGSILSTDPELAHPEGFVKEIVPPTWVIEKGKNPLAKMPGKRKLLKDPQLKKKLLGEKIAKKRKQVPWTRRHFGPHWHALDIPVSEAGMLETPQRTAPITEAGPFAMNYLPAMLAIEPPAPPPELVPCPTEHPHSMPQDNEPATTNNVG